MQARNHSKINAMLFLTRARFSSSLPQKISTAAANTRRQHYSHIILNLASKALENNGVGCLLMAFPSCLCRNERESSCLEVSVLAALRKSPKLLLPLCIILSNDSNVLPLPFSRVWKREEGDSQYSTLQKLQHQTAIIMSQAKVQKKTIDFFR